MINKTYKDMSKLTFIITKYTVSTLIVVAVSEFARFYTGKKEVNEEKREDIDEEKYPQRKIEIMYRKK